MKCIKEALANKSGCFFYDPIAKQYQPVLVAARFSRYKGRFCLSE